MRRAGSALGAALVACALAQIAHAQALPWKPQRPVEFVVAAGAGGPLDQTARLAQRIWQERRFVEVAVLVNPKPGGSQAIAYSYLNAHPADGHTLCIASQLLLTNRITGVHPLNHTDVTPLAQLFNEYVAFGVRADSPIKSGRDLVDTLKKNPGGLVIGVGPALATTNHIAMISVAREAGIDVPKLKVIVFKATPEAMTALLGGHVDVIPVPASLLQAQAQAGAIRVIAAAAPTRFTGTFANVPTWKEQGFNTVVGNFRVVIGPKGMPPAQVAYWDNAFGALTKTVEWKKELEKGLWHDDYMASEQTRKFLDAEYQQLRVLFSDLGLAKSPN